MNENELRFLFAKLGILGIPLSWACLPILVSLVVVEAALQSINSESGGELDERSNNTIEEDND